MSHSVRLKENYNMHISMSSSAGTRVWAIMSGIYVEKLL